MNTKKAVLTGFALLIAILWAGHGGLIPVPDAVHDAAVGIVGVVGLALGNVFRALGVVAGPLLAVLRVLIVPITLGLVAWLLLRELRRARD